MKKIVIVCGFIFVSGCFEDAKEIVKDNRIEMGEVKINYYADKSVTSLEVPPDLTKPSYESSFRLSEFVKKIDSNTVNLTDKEIESDKSNSEKIKSEILVKKSGNRRWLVVNKDSELIWNLTQQFFKEQGFIIKNSNKKIGFMETDYLENKPPTIPAKSMGLFRSMIAASVGNVNYTLPTVDKYKVRIEPSESSNKTEVFLSLHSMAEVITGSGSNESTLWQKSPKDFQLENEMLYRLMIYLGGEAANARERILSAKEEGKISVDLVDGINGYAKLVFKLDLIDTWDNVSWAINESNIQLEDKDIKEKTFYVNVARSSDRGFMSRIFGDDAILKPFQILLRDVDGTTTEVLFNDISELNEQETKEFSYELFREIKKLF